MPSLRTSASLRRDRVREHDRKRHQLRGLVRRVAEHDPLVARADPIERIVVPGVVLHLEGVVDPLGDVGRLLVERDDHCARLGVEAVLGAGVADLGDPVANEPGDVDVCRGGDLARDDDEAGRHQRLARDAPVGVVGQDGVEDRVRDLVGDLVRVAFGDGLGGDRKGSSSDLRTLAFGSSARLAEVWTAPRRTGRLTRLSAFVPSARRRARRASVPRAPSRRSR